MTRDGDLYFDEEWATYDPAAVAQAAWKRNGRRSDGSRQTAEQRPNLGGTSYATDFAICGFSPSPPQISTVKRVMREVSEFARRLRWCSDSGRPSLLVLTRAPPGRPWVARELLHLDVSGPPLMAEIWGLGFVFVVDYATARRSARGEPLGLCRSPREACRRASAIRMQVLTEGLVCRTRRGEQSPLRGRPGLRSDQGKPLGDRSGRGRRHRPEPAVARRLAALTVWDSIDAEEWPRPPVRTYRW